MNPNVSELFGRILSLMFSVGAQLVWALIAALIFAAKDKSWFSGAVLGFFLGPFGVLIALFVSADRSKQIYAPQPDTSIPTAHTVASLQPQFAPKPVEYRLPGRCPNCNAPLKPQTLQSPYAVCMYCGSQIEAVTV